MKERPILFSAPMVRALLEGRKTQTRRVMKLQPEPVYGMWVWKSFVCESGDNPSIFGPYVIGDRLWVRETWGKWDNGGGQIRYRADLRCFEAMTDAEGHWLVEDHGGSLTKDPGGWRPSIFMPRWASRITLEITDVRVQRLQEISHSDAYDEGVDCIGLAISRFQELWESINAKKHPWESNPWVWAITFEVRP